MIEMIETPSRISHAPAGYKRLTTNLPAGLHAALKIHAVEQGTTITSLIERLVAGELTDKDAL